MTSVVKRDRRVEKYDREKLAKSIVGICLSVRAPAGEAENTAQKICEDVDAWLRNRPEVTSADLRRRAAKTLKIYNTDAAYYYENQKQIM